MDEQQYLFLDSPEDEDRNFLLRHPQALLRMYLDCRDFINQSLRDFQANRDAYQAIAQISEMELADMKKRISELEAENLRLRQFLNESPSVGRPPKYDAQTRRLVVDFYNESTAHTYIVTAKHFNMSTSTLRAILKDARDNDIPVRSRRP